MIVPLSIWYTPVNALMRVDLPAPFSPMSAWTSPERNEKSTLSSASTPGNLMVIPLICTMGGTSLSSRLVTRETFSLRGGAPTGGGKHYPPPVEHYGLCLLYTS